INFSQNFVRFQKSLLTNKLETLKQNINERNLEQIELEYKLKLDLPSSLARKQPRTRQDCRRGMGWVDLRKK
ncbi:MAG: hypothetical protein Q8835_03045, partial [Sweet potato little leaf phytoplasma]|nr:hypothetical protein [Sweet potato little leaf phytoplasma]